MYQLKTILLVFTMLSGLSVYSQDWMFEKPDYDKIKHAIADKDGSFYYPNLMERFVKADSTLTLKEKRHLYYGYIFDRNYAPYSRTEMPEKLEAYLQEDEPTGAEINELLTFYDAVLAKNPFDLETMNTQLYFYDKIDNREKFNERLFQMQAVIDALLSSGNGESKEEAFYVTSTSDEYSLIAVLGFEFGGKQSLIGQCDYLTLKENDAKIEGLYFDVSACLNTLSFK